MRLTRRPTSFRSMLAPSIAAFARWRIGDQPLHRGPPLAPFAPVRTDNRIIPEIGRRMQARNLSRCLSSNGTRFKGTPMQLRLALFCLALLAASLMIRLPAVWAFVDATPTELAARVRTKVVLIDVQVGRGGR